MTAATTVSDLAVNVLRKPGSQVCLGIEAPESEFDIAVAAALRRFAARVRIPGFRPGKAPSAIVERHIGWEAVRQEAVEALIPALYLRAVSQEGIEPVGEPSIDFDPATVDRGKPVIFSATVTTRPEVGLGDYRGLRVDAPHTEVTDADVDVAIEQVRKRYATSVTVDREARMGDVVTCLLEMRHGDELLTSAGEERDLELDQEQLLSGLADQVVGMTAGQDRTFELTLPEDYPREELRGKQVSVTCAVKSVKEQQLPALDDHLAQLAEQGTTLHEMRESYRGLLVDQAGQRDRDQLENEVLTKFRDGIDVDIPEAMVNAEVDRQIRDLEQRFKSLGLSWEQYLSMSGETNEQIRGERRESAVQRVKLELGLDALIKEESLEVDESAVAQEAKRIAAGQRLSESQRARLEVLARKDLARQAAASRLLEIARGEE